MSCTTGCTSMSTCGSLDEDDQLQDSTGSSRPSVLEVSMHVASTEAINEYQRLTKRATDTQIESKRRRIKAKRQYRNEVKQARELMQESQRIQVDAKQAGDLAVLLNYKKILLQLRRNDPDTDKVDGRHFPHGHWRALGEALTLRKNNVVTTLYLDLSFLWPPDGRLVLSQDQAEDELRPIYRYLFNNATLLQFDVRNSDQGGGYQASMIPHLANLLIASISFSRQLQQLSWTDLPVAAGAIHGILTTFDSLHTLDISLINAALYTTDEQQMIVTAFSSHQLKLVKLAVGVTSNVTLYTAILSSLQTHQNRASLQELHLRSDADCNDNFFHGICEYLRSTDTLQRFILEGFRLGEGRMGTIVSGLQKPFRGNQDLLDNTDTSLSTTTTVTVSALHFLSCDISRESLSSLLRTRAAASDRPCAVGSNNNDRGHSSDILLARPPGICHSALRELHISPKEEGEDNDLHLNMLDFYLAMSLCMANSAETTAAATPTTDNEVHVATTMSSRGVQHNTGTTAQLELVPLVPTVGSQLCTLSLGRPNSLLFCDQHLDRLRLERLELHGLLSFDVCKAFGRSIPKWTSLRHVTVTRVESTTGMAWILNGLKQSGSICSVCTTSDTYPTSDFDESQLQLIEAFCQRNRLLETLLAWEPPNDEVLVLGAEEDVGDDAQDDGGGDEEERYGGDSSSGECDDDDGDDDKGSNEDSSNGTPGIPPVAGLLVRPALLQVAQQIPNQQTTTLIRGLLKLEQYIGNGEIASASNKPCLD